MESTRTIQLRSNGQRSSECSEKKTMYLVYNGPMSSIHKVSFNRETSERNRKGVGRKTLTLWKRPEAWRSMDEQAEEGVKALGGPNRCL